MGKITQIHVGYELKNPPVIIEPNDELEGIIIVTNNSEKDQKLKELFIELVESYDQDFGEGFSPVKEKIKSYYLNTRGLIRAGETQEYQFKIKLTKWKRKKGKKYNDWNLQLRFKQKTKLIASRGSISRNATCILPVKGTMVTPSFGDPQASKKKK